MVLSPEHLAESTLLGTGFLVSGILQVGLAAAVVRRPQDALLSLSLMINAALMALYFYAVLVGLPFAGSADSEHSTGLAIGAGEPIDAAGAVAKLAELAALCLAIVLMRRTARSSAVTALPQSPPAPVDRANSGEL